MIRFLYGAGSVQTTERLTDAIRQIVAGGEQAILLVPEQETVSAERNMLRLLPAGAQLNFEVLNFTRLANRTYRAVGGLYRNNVTPAAEILLLYRTLRELAPVLLQYGDKTAVNPRFCEKLLSAKASLGVSMISPELLLSAADQLEETDALGKKLRDLGTVFSTHDAYLDACFGHHRDDLAKLPEILLRHGKSLFGNTHIYIDSFTDFTKQELEILRVLFGIAKSVTVTFATSNPGQEGLQFLSTCRTEQKLRRFAAEHGRKVFFDAEREEKPKDALSYLRRYLFDMSAEPASLSFAGSGQITLTRCKNPMAEAEHVAEQIHRLIRGGARYREITVVARDAASLAGILDTTLEKEGIPCFLSEKTDLTAKPLLKLILSALSILRFGFRSEDVIGYLKTGLCGVHRDEVTFFEDYLSVWKFRGKAAYTAPFLKNPDGFSPTLSARGERILAIANRVREIFLPPLLALETDLRNATDAKGQITAIFHLLSTLRVSEQLRAEAGRRLAAGERKEAEELARLFSVTTETLNTAVKVLGEETYAVRELQDALQLAFSHTNIGTIPTSADEVTIGSASMLRADHPRYVIVVGLTEGCFPENTRQEGILDEKDCRRLKELGLEISTKAETAASDELFYVWRAFTAPSELLRLSYSSATLAGKATSPSMAVGRVKALFPTLRETRFEATAPIDRMFTVANAEEHLMQCRPGERAIIRKILQEKLPESPSLTARAVTDAEATVDPEIARNIFNRRKLSPSHLEKYAGCRFSYYCSNVLQLREDAADTFSDADVGTYIHFILEKAIAKVQETGTCKNFTEEQTDALIRGVAAEYRKKLHGLTGDLSPRAEALFARLDLLAGIVVRGLFAELGDSLFRPAFLELNLKTFGEVPHISLKSGGTLPLTGKADRVDFWKGDDGKAYFRVVDYKTGEHRFDPEIVRKGASMQMPLYLLALCKNEHPTLCRMLGLPENTPFYPAGITYLTVGVRSDATNTETAKEAALSKAINRMTRSGVILDDADVKHALSLSSDSNILGKATRSGKGKNPFLDMNGFELLFDDLSAAVTDLSENMQKGLADARPRAYAGRVPCEYCRFGAICRAAQKKN